MAYDNVALMRRYIEEVWNKGNYAVVNELMSPSSVAHDPMAGDLTGPEAVIAQVREYRSAYPDLHFRIEDIAALGDKVFLRYTATGTHKGPIMGVPPSGRSAAISGMTLARLANGKLVESWAQWDTLKFLAELGLLPAFGQTAAASEAKEARPH